MYTESPGGLSGKERRIRNRNRAVRLTTRQMIEEYLEPDWFEARPRRHVPIRSRSDFLPSAVEADESSFAAQPMDQDMFADNLAAEPAIPVIKPRRILRSAGEQGPTWKDSVISFPGWSQRRAVTAKADEPVATVATEPAEESFRFTGFLLGCAMGSAAATLALLVVRIAVGVLV